MFKLFLSAIFLCTVSTPALAQINTEDATDHRLSLGLAVLAFDSIYLDGDSQSQVFPAIDYQYKQFYVQGGELGFHLFQNDTWQLDLGIGANLAGDTDRGDSDRLQDMPDLSLPVNAFLSVQHTSSLGVLELAYASEINNKHNGDSVEFSYSIPFPIEQWLLLPNLSINHFSEQSINYFYAVPDAFSLVTRPTYRADSELIYSAGITAIRPINDTVTFFANASFNSYGDEITDSPIVDEEDSYSIFVGFTYQVF